MTDPHVHDRQSFEDQGAQFLRANTRESEFNYAANRPPHSHRLAGTTYTLAMRDSDERYGHMFTDREVKCEILGGSGAGRSVTVPYEAFELAPGIFFVTYLWAENDSVAVALDLGKGVATLVMGKLAADGIVSTLGQARIEEVTPTEPMAYHPAASLGGTRFLNTYADNVAYEHIYLTGVYETWMGVKGPQAGQADTEEYRAWKIADGVYLLYWNEAVLTAQMTFLFNFFDGRCVAEVFARTDGERVHSTIGAYTHLIHTKLPELPNVTRLDIYSGD
ncbi:MAG: molybdenum cofactor biosynthesis F family protein [Actinobacteria bacterium]|nr:molybdenum cofactor biosynthesis F family protein [Actinomycetota bacterium]